MNHQKSLVALVILASVLILVEGKASRCFSCRSRGSQGDCKDPFTFNSTDLIKGITTPSCISQWCTKFIEGISGPPDEFGTAIERSCLPIAPSDGEERCAETTIRNKRTLVCFCKGDLCNSATSIFTTYSSLITIFSIILYLVYS